MQAITDEFMQQMLTKTKTYTFVLLKQNPAYKKEVDHGILWEHARRNFALRAEGSLNIVAPVAGENNIAGLALFNKDAKAVKTIMDEDPAVKEGILLYELMPVRSFPGDSLA